MVKALLDAGANPDLQDAMCKTAMHYVSNRKVGYQTDQTIQVLFDAGAVSPSRAESLAI